jgi:hypothetical protein
VFSSGLVNYIYNYHMILERSSYGIFRRGTPMSPKAKGWRRAQGSRRAQLFGARRDAKLTGPRSRWRQDPRDFR